MEKWREDAQLGELEDASAAEEPLVKDEVGDSAETDPIEDRWARIGVFPTVAEKPLRGPARDTDHTVTLRGDVPRDAVPAGGPRDTHRSARLREEPAAASRRERSDTDRLAAAFRGEPADTTSPRGADGITTPRGERTPGPRDADRFSPLRKGLGDSPRGAEGVAAPRGERAGDDGTVSRDSGAVVGRSAEASADTLRKGEARPPRGDGAPERDSASGPGTEPRSATGSRSVDGARDVERTTMLRGPAAGGEDVVGVRGPERDSGSGFGVRDVERTTMLRGPAAGATSPRSTSTAADVAVSASVRDPWQEEPVGEAAAATHDPHEVTVQLDAVRFGEGGVLGRAPATSKGGERDGADGPVFVDESGRRSRRYRRIGMAVGLACACYAAVIVATLLSGNSDAPWLPVPGQQQERQPAAEVETSPRPGETDATPGSGTSLLPGGSPSPGASTLPRPGTGVPAPGATAGQDRPGTTAAPEPTATRKTQQPGTGTQETSTPTAPVETPGTPPANTTPPADDPGPGTETTAPTTGGGDDDGTTVDNAAGADDSQPVAAGNPGAEPGSPAPSAAPSPEYVL